mmetsp:Transcript_26216/g.61869  ORF Transcript_26216/g.61869 Transcript_26216/m.61869 type:complete len:128 (-) Transcript_26216:488-871(-)
MTFSFSTVICSAQVSGQSWGQAPKTVRVVIVAIAVQSEAGLSQALPRRARPGALRGPVSSLDRERPAKADAEAVPGIDRRDGQAQVHQFGIAELAARELVVRIAGMACGDQGQRLGPRERRLFAAAE